MEIKHTMQWLLKGGKKEQCFQVASKKKKKPERKTLPEGFGLISGSSSHSEGFFLAHRRVGALMDLLSLESVQHKPPQTDTEAHFEVSNLFKLSEG